jgi:hypothetical protein
MTNYAETSPEFTQLDQRLNKVFKGYRGVKLAIRILAIAFGAGWLVMLIPGAFTIALLAYVSNFTTNAAVPGVFVCYWVALGFVVVHGRIMKAYDLALQRTGEEPTVMYLRGKAGFKEARRQAILLGIGVMSPLVFFIAFFALMTAAHQH